MNVFTNADFLPSEVTDQPPEKEVLGDDDRMLIVNDITKLKLILNQKIRLRIRDKAVPIAIRLDLPSTSTMPVSRAVNTKEVLQQGSSHCVVIEIAFNQLLL